MDWTTGTGVFQLPLTSPGSHPVVATFFASGSKFRWAPSSAQLTQTVSQVPVESDPPVADVVIDGGAALTTDGYAVLTMHATDVSQITSIRISCDQATWTNGGTTNGDWGWGWGNDGCSPQQGTKTIYVEFRDMFGNTTVATDSIVLENAPPAGTIVVAGGATYSTSPAVTLQVGATDPATGVSMVGLSNDGATWTYRAYAPTQAWTLVAGNGVRTVYSKWRDGYGNWSAPKSDTIVLDTVAPTAVAPAQTLVTGSELSAGLAPVRLLWSGSDTGTGILRYELAQRVDGDAWSSPTPTTATSALVNLYGHTYQFAIRAVDQAGHVGAWAFGPAFKVAGVSQAYPAVHYAGTWATSTSPTWWGGTAKSSSKAGSTVTYSFTGRSIAWVGFKGINRGKAQVYVNGVLRATVDLYAATSQKQRIVWSTTYATSATRTVLIKVLGTSGRPRVDADGFLVIS
jgi:hypothetical protein